ncbi:sensor histidine kinase [Brevibacterium album]|uniref:sensor histidine kinase n=1 Tax=Brevibacterium album TaxID=417948 RepID=UPI00040113C5|nr:histidine kinase [Brevibacterium album]
MPGTAEAFSPARSLARIRTFTTQGFVVAWAIAWLVTLASAAHTWWHPLMFLPAAALSLQPILRWHSAYSGRTAILGLATGALTWTACALLAVSPSGVIALVIPAVAMVRGGMRTKLLAGSGITAACAGIGLLTLTTQSHLAGLFIIFGLWLPAFWALVFWSSRASWNLLLELDSAHQAQTDLAVLRERFRIAADLHDIQGHTLHVVKLKTALAQRLVRADPTAAEAEIAQVQELIAETIGQSRALAHGERPLTLAGELENARRLFEADDVEVRIRLAGRPAGTAEALCSLVLREATTNVLRHSQATRVHIVLSDTGLLIVNDGAEVRATPELSGLAGLRRRVEEAGGRLHVRVEEGDFLTEAAFPGTELPGTETPETETRTDKQAEKGAADGDLSRPRR